MIGTYPLDALEKTAWKRLSITKGRYSQIHGMANAQNKFIRTSDTLSSHFAFFFFFNASFWGEFSFKIGKKNILFGEGNGAQFQPPKQQKKNTVRHGASWTIIVQLAPCQISLFLIIFAAENLTWWETLKTGFLTSQPKYCFYLLTDSVLLCTHVLRLSKKDVKWLLVLWQGLKISTQ